MGRMEIPEDVLQVLKCSRCSGLLSWAPVFLCPDGGGLCAACHAAEPCVRATRNTQYEAVASLLLFPCRHRAEGCAEQLAFTDLAAHDEECRHRQYVCPVLGPAACDWSGSAVRILDHCRQQHPDRVLSSPATLTHDIAHSTSHIYLLQAFHLLFLLFTKVCVTSGKIYYSISFLGKSSEAQNFKFTLNIMRNEERLIKKGQVVPKGCLAIQEDSSLKININYLIGVLDGFTDTTFTVTLDTLQKMFACIKCNFLLTVREYCDSKGWKCGYCAPGKINCRYSNRGCEYMSFKNKVKKHQDYFCNFATKCFTCNEYVDDQFLKHLEKKHLTFASGTAWRTNGNKIVLCLIQSKAGKVAVLYKWYDTYFELFVRTPLLNDELSNFCCTVKVTLVSTNETRTYNPDTLYDQYNDWFVKVTNEDFSVWSETFDIRVTLT